MYVMATSSITRFSMDAILGTVVPPDTREHQPTTRRRRTRTVFSLAAVKRMESEFSDNRYPDIRRREAIAADIDLSEARIQVWFQNRRARCNKRRRDMTTVPDGVFKRQREEASTSSGSSYEKQYYVASTCSRVSLLTPELTPDHGTRDEHLGFAQPSAFWYFQNSFKSSAPAQSMQSTKQNSDLEDDFVKRLFRFSSVHTSVNPVLQEVIQEKQLYRMVVPQKKSSECSVSGLHVAECRVSDSAAAAGELGSVFPLDDEDSGLANDSLCDST